MAMETRKKNCIWASLAVGSVLLLAGAVWFAAPRVRALAQKTTEVGATVGQAYHTAAVAKQLLDAEPDQVLLLFQNSWEQRPTGGFVTALGEGTIVRGRIENLSVVASNAYDVKQTLQPPMPVAMQGWISTPYLMLRDANWDPDFPTAAATVQRLYADATGLQPDLVVAVTTGAVERLVEITGPIDFTVNGRTISVNHANVTERLEQLTDVDFATLGLDINSRKQILAEFAAELLPKIEQQMARDPFGTAALLYRLLGTYDVQVWSQNVATDAHLAALGARREVTAVAVGADALLVVDANLNSYKTDPYIEREGTYEVRLDAHTATLTLTYRNTSTAAQRLTTTYNDYVRVYVPTGSSLLEATGLTEPATTQRHGRTVFSGMISVPQGQERTMTLHVALSPTIGRDVANYSLRLEGQAGSTPWQLTATVAAGDTRKTLHGTVRGDVTLR